MIEFEGKGTKNNPYYLINKNLKYDYEIKDSENYIELINCEFEETIILKNCRNVKITSCKSKGIYVKKSRNVEFSFCQTKFFDIISSEQISVKTHKIERFYLRDCSGLLLKNCAITCLIMEFCYNNSVIGCDIEDLDIEYSRGNFFEKNKLDYNKLSNINRHYTFREKYGSLEIFLIFIVAFLSFIGFFYLLQFPLLIILTLIIICAVIWGILLFIFTLSLYRQDKRIKKIDLLPDNRIIR
ncbi:MAG: hypothetical protein ACP6IY_05425 [Promethearchaeia archaeon]